MIVPALTTMFSCFFVVAVVFFLTKFANLRQPTDGDGIPASHSRCPVVWSKICGPVWQHVWSNRLRFGRNSYVHQTMKHS